MGFSLAVGCGSCDLPRVQSVVVSGTGISYTCSIALGGNSKKLGELLE